MSARPLPDVGNKTSGPFWAAARDGKIVVQCCDQCKMTRWPPAAICPECLHNGHQWIELSGRGTIWSYAIYRRAFNQAFAEEVPYVVALVELEEGVRMITNLVSEHPQIEVGAPVRAVFDAITPEVTLVKFEVLTPEAASE